MSDIVLLITSSGTNKLALQQLAENPRAVKKIKQFQGKAVRSYLELTPGPSVRRDRVPVKCGGSHHKYTGMVADATPSDQEGL